MTARAWEWHQALLGTQRPRGFPDASDELLALKLELATALASPCRLCARECGVDRPAGERGFCGVGWPGRIGEEHIHFGELPQYLPTHSVFLSGCTMHCVYCRKGRIVADADQGRPFEPDAFAQVVEARRLQGARSLKLLGGTPEPQLPQVIRLLRALPHRLPVLWETTMYVTPAVAELYVGLIDCLVCNVRYGADACAEALSEAPGYVDVAREAMRAIAGRIPVSLRHLALPGHADCCTAGVAATLQELFPDDPLVLLTQYEPFGAAMGDPVLGHALTRDEAQYALQVARRHKEKVQVWELE